MMDKETRAHFVAHIESLTDRSIAGDFDAAKSLACMALLVERDETGGDGEMVKLKERMQASCEVIDYGAALKKLAA